MGNVDFIVIQAAAICQINFTVLMALFTYSIIFFLKV